MSASRTKFTKTTAIAACLLCCSSFANELSPFNSDGCSAFPDGTPAIKTLWLSCCTAHDLAYWRGGTYNERLHADKELRQCVAKTGQNNIAELMLKGVRVGGTPYLPTSFRWGYGWPYMRGYKALTEEEEKLVQMTLNTYTDRAKSKDTQ